MMRYFVTWEMQREDGTWRSRSKRWESLALLIWLRKREARHDPYETPIRNVRWYYTQQMQEV